jgi:hypothetical protein
LAIIIFPKKRKISQICGKFFFSSVNLTNFSFFFGKIIIANLWEKEQEEKYSSSQNHSSI